jgi:dUTP pyrophosphatase
MIISICEVKIKKIRNEAVIPTLGSNHSIGYDLYSTIDYILPPNENVVIPSGFALSMPIGLGAFIISRSGLGAKHGIIISNGTGLIDPDYRGEVGITLYNRSSVPFEIKKRDRIAQMYFVETPYIRFLQVEELDDTERGEGGFGSTGGY